MRKIVVGSAIFIIALVSCVTFSPISLMNSLPNDIKNRNLYPDTAQWKYHLDQLVGSIIYEKIEGGYSIGKRIIKPETVLAKDPLDTAKSYRLFTDNKAEADLKLIAFGGITLNQEEKIEIRMTDTISYFIKYEEFDIAELKKEFKKPLPKGYKNRYFIQGTILTLILKSVYQNAKQGINTKISGLGMSADGSIYSNQVVNLESPDYLIGLTLRDQTEIEILGTTKSFGKLKVEGLRINGLNKIDEIDEN